MVLPLHRDAQLQKHKGTPFRVLSIRTRNSPSQTVTRNTFPCELSLFGNKRGLTHHNDIQDPTY